MQGTIKSYNTLLKYGFIECERGEAYFHICAFLDDIPPCTGMKVNFEYRETDKGGVAQNITLLDNNGRSSTLVPTVNTQPQPQYNQQPQYYQQPQYNQQNQYYQQAPYGQQNQYYQQPQQNQNYQQAPYNQQYQQAQNNQQPEESQQSNSQPQKPLYVKIGSARVQLDMIERYGIKDYVDNYLRDLLLDWELANESVEKYGDSFINDYNIADRKLEEYTNSERFKINQNDKVLYIKLSNGETMNFRQSKCGFNIYEALQRLDSYLCG